MRDFCASARAGVAGADCPRTCRHPSSNHTTLWSSAFRTPQRDARASTIRNPPPPYVVNDLKCSVASGAQSTTSTRTTADVTATRTSKSVRA